MKKKAIEKSNGNEMKPRQCNSLGKMVITTRNFQVGRERGEVVGTHVVERR